MQDKLKRLLKIMSGNNPDRLLAMYKKLQKESKLTSEEFYNILDAIAEDFRMRYIKYIATLHEDGKVRYIGFEELITLLKDMDNSADNEDGLIKVSIDISVYEAKYVVEMLRELREVLHNNIRNNLLTLSNKEGRSLVIAWVIAHMDENRPRVNQEVTI